jgi:LPPG:FO 2-phospho-L-lactate transferase
LAGRFDEERGWGIRGDVTDSGGHGTAPWFSLGVQDRQQHERRTQLLAQGLPLSGAVATMAAESGVRARVLPATDAPRGTVVVTADGPRAFQEWLVRDHAGPEVLDVRWPADATEPAPGVLTAIDEADVVVLTSSSPVASLEPTLTLAGVSEALRRRKDAGRPVVLLSPVVAGLPPEIDRDRRRHRAREALLAARGVAHEPTAVAEHFAHLTTHAVLDPADAALAPALPDDLGVLLGPIVDQSRSARQALVEACLLTFAAEASAGGGSGTRS